jgi:hypothetical protein
MRLFSADALSALYVKLSCPTLVLFDEDPNVDLDRLSELVKRNEYVHAKRIAPTLGLPQWEEPEQTVAALNAFFAGDLPLQ